MFKPAEPYVPPISPQELTVTVFDNPAGIELLQHWMAISGLTSFVEPLGPDHMIRINEQQRFVHSILRNLAMTPDQIREATIARHEKRNTRKATYE